MSYKIIETTRHDYDPVNKYIDEQTRLRRTKSIWKNTKSLALFLLALGIFFILLAYAYHIFKKPHHLQKINSPIDSKIEQKLNNDIERKNKEINSLENKLKNNPENQKLKNEIEKLKAEKRELKEELESVVYDSEVVIFEYKYSGEYTITTGYQWDNVDDLRYGKNHTASWCYIGLSNGSSLAKYYFDHEDINQTNLIVELGFTNKNEINNYKKFCKNY